jgi:hypothetical protein
MRIIYSVLFVSSAPLLLAFSVKPPIRIHSHQTVKYTASLSSGDFENSGNESSDPVDDDLPMDEDMVVSDCSLKVSSRMIGI